MIKIENLTRTYGDFTAVDRVSFEIKPGEIVGLLGHNGAGKTTIMKMMTGFLEPTAGHIEIDSLSPDVDLQAIQGKIGYLPENCPVYPEMTVIDYLDYAASLRGVPAGERVERVREAIRRTELTPKAANPISTLSRGYRQRVGVAQAILHKPKIFILDEPTNGLDPTQIQHMRELVKTLAQEATVIISTHILQEVQAVCDRVIIIRNGQKALDAKLADLQADSRLLVGMDAALQQARPVLGGIEGVESLEELPGTNGRHTYALSLAAEANRDEIAAQVADAVHDNQWKLYELSVETRDLETIFGEISASEGGI